MTDVTQILSRIDSGDPTAAEKLLPLVYDELRKLAAAKLAQEKPGQTLQATALVHEAYLRLVGSAEGDSPRWTSRHHFFAAAAQAMRRILVDQARRRRRVRHGGELRRVDMDSQLLVSGETDDQLVALDEALDRLAAEDSEAAEVVKLRYFAGLSINQIALALNISVRTARRDWVYARAWLYRQLR
jgi:RNA polymerase sigma factor (TIGR02999 family)